MDCNNKVYVIIVTYNAINWIDTCLGSLKMSTVPLHCVVIDNMSKDGTVEYIKKKFPETHIIENSENKGFGQANNQGIIYARNQGATHYFLLNQDAWVYPDTIGKLIDVQKKEGLSIVSPVHLNGPGDEMDLGFFNAAVISEGNNAFVSDLMLDKLKPMYQVEYINAAAWMMSQHCVETIGGFDPLFFHYGEDRNYCQRLKYHGEKLGFVPDAYIHHDREKHGNQTLYDKRGTLNKLLITYSDINKPAVHPCLARFKIHADFLLRSLKCLFTLKFKAWWFIIFGYGAFLSKLGAIRRSRRVDAQKGDKWLDSKEVD